MKNEDMITEIQASNMEIDSLKRQVDELRTVVNNNKSVLFELLEVLKNAKIPYRN